MCVFVGWHLVAQILYFVGVTLVLLSFIFSQLQFCCHRERVSAFRTLAGVLLFSCKTISICFLFHTKHPSIIVYRCVVYTYRLDPKFRVLSRHFYDHLIVSSVKQSGLDGQAFGVFPTQPPAPTP